MLGAAQQHASVAEYEDVSELTPVLTVAIDDERDARVRVKVPHPLQLVWRHSLGLLVDRGKELFAVEDEADWDYVRLSMLVRRCQMGNAGGAD